eukprot:11112379-Alexandrium_andersonii.AAC.1
MRPRAAPYVAGTSSGVCEHGGLLGAASAEKKAPNGSRGVETLASGGAVEASRLRGVEAP